MVTCAAASRAGCSGRDLNAPRRDPASRRSACVDRPWRAPYRPGPAALALVVQTLRRDATVPLVGLSPSIDNASAQRAYEKADFCKICEYEALGFGRCALMIMPLA